MYDACMTLRTIFLCFFGAIVAGIVLGAIVGALLGALSPSLIGLFMGNVGADDPFRTGIALGLLNGGIYGFFGGAVIVIAWAIICGRGMAK